MQPEMGQLDHMADVFLALGGTSMLFSIMAALISVLASSMEGFLSSSSEPAYFFFVVLILTSLTRVRGPLIVVSISFP